MSTGKITFHPLIDDPGGRGPTGRRWYKRADGVNVGLIRIDGVDVYTSERYKQGQDDWTIVLASLNGEELDRREHLPHSEGKHALVEMVRAR